jgi:hypothetical protein
MNCARGFNYPFIHAFTTKCHITEAALLVLDLRLVGDDLVGSGFLCHRFWWQQYSVAGFTQLDSSRNKDVSVFATQVAVKNEKERRNQLNASKLRSQLVVAAFRSLFCRLSSS